MTAPTKSPGDLTVIPMLSRVWPLPVQRKPALSELRIKTSRMIDGTRVVLASVLNVGGNLR